MEQVNEVEDGTRFVQERKIRMKSVKRSLALLIVLCHVGIVHGALMAAERITLDRGWSFALNGGAVQKVDVPHDWSIAFAPHAASPSVGHGGFYDGGVGVYERTFSLTDDDLTTRELELVFDGVYRDADVAVNGAFAGKGTFYGFTGFSIALTNGLVRAGENALKVTVHTENQPTCRWYAGSGIYRHVWLVKHPRGKRVSDVFVKTALDGTVEISGRVGGRLVRKTHKIDHPILWTPETPHLYDFDFYGEKLKVGIRTIAWDVDEGFLLSGKPIKLHGACVHADHGPLGAASFDAAEIRKVRQLKRAGFNAVRLSHHPFSTAFLDACDAEGLLVEANFFDVWRVAKTKHDYSQVFAHDWKRDLTWTVLRDRNHPSLIMWEIGNEIKDGGTPQGIADATALVNACRALDPTRPVTSANFDWGSRGQRGRWWRGLDAIAAQLDIFGYNYVDHYMDGDRVRDPGRLCFYSETFPTRVVEVWRRIMSHKTCIGGFVWTGQDHYGNASIGMVHYPEKEPYYGFESKKAFPWHGTACGDIDITGWRKPVSHLRETLWNEKAPTYLCVNEPNGWRGHVKVERWGVWPMHEHWNFEGWEGKNIVVEAHSRAPCVRFSINGKVYAERPNSAKNAWRTYAPLPYTPGELMAEGLDANGKVIDRAILRTAGAPKTVRFIDEETIGDLTWVRAEVVDEKGVLCPYAAKDVTFEGDILGTCSGDMKDCVPAPSRTRRTWHGRAMAIRRNR